MPIPTKVRLDLTEVFRAHPHARQILEVLSRAGHEAVLVGGVVRDLLRAQFEFGVGAGAGADERLVPQEVDIATSAAPSQVRRLFPGWKALEVGVAFGVLVLVAPDGQRYEVATFRRERDYDGRRPGHVQLVPDLESDVRRRDFTVNGLAARSDGTVLDYVGGLADLKARVIRTIGDPDERFREDALRLLRAVRFACALGATIEEETAKALRAHRDGLRRVSAERVREELFKLLATEAAARGIRLLDEYGLLALILPEVAALHGVPQPEDYHPEGDVYTHTLMALEVADRLHFSPLVKLAVLLHDVGKPEAFLRNAGEHMGGHERSGEAIVKVIGRRLRLSADQAKTLGYLVREHLRIAKLPEMGRGKQVRFLKGAEVQVPGAPVDDLKARFPDFVALLQLLICDAQASAHKSGAWLPVLRTTVELLAHLRELEALEAARKLLDGEDLLRLGVPQGPRIGEILEAVYERIFAGEIKSRRGALEAAKRLIRSNPHSHSHQRGLPK